MGESAYDALVGEFLRFGVAPKASFNLAGLLMPDEAIDIQSEERLEAMTQYILGQSHHDFDEFAIGFEESETCRNVQDHLHESKTRKRAIVYVDGANLSRSLAYSRENEHIEEGVLVREISIDPKNYKRPTIEEDYPLWFLAWCLLAATKESSALLEECLFVMCADNEGGSKYIQRAQSEFGCTTVTPEKLGDGLGSSGNEDEVLKARISKDLSEDRFDIAVIATGDGAANDGTSFPSIAREIENEGKEVVFVGFQISASRKIRDHFEFLNLDELIFRPR